MIPAVANPSGIAVIKNPMNTPAQSSSNSSFPVLKSVAAPSMQPYAIISDEGMLPKGTQIAAPAKNVAIAGATIPNTNVDSPS